MSNKITISNVIDLDKKSLSELYHILVDLGVPTKFIINEDLNRCVIIDVSGIQLNIKCHSLRESKYGTSHLEKMRAWYIKRIKEVMKRRANE